MRMKIKRIDMKKARTDKCCNALLQWREIDLISLQDIKKYILSQKPLMGQHNTNFRIWMQIRKEAKTTIKY